MEHEEEGFELAAPEELDDSELSAELQRHRSRGPLLEAEAQRRQEAKAPAPQPAARAAAVSQTQTETPPAGDGGLAAFEKAKSEGRTDEDAQAEYVRQKRLAASKGR